MTSQSRGQWRDVIVFIVSLAVADLMVGVVVLPFSSANEVRGDNSNGSL